MKQEFADLTGLEVGDTIFFIADKEERANLFADVYKRQVYDTAVCELHERGIEVITHVILGLPG